MKSTNCWKSILPRRTRNEGNQRCFIVGRMEPPGPRLMRMSRCKVCYLALNEITKEFLWIEKVAARAALCATR
jgi:hypothetical protein